MMQLHILQHLPAYLRKVKINKQHVLYGVLIMLLLLVSSISLFRLSPYIAHGGPSQYFRAMVLQTKQANSEYDGPQLNVNVRLMDGPDKNKTVAVSWNDSFGDAAYKRLPIGSQVLLSKEPKSKDYGLVSRWYMPGIATLFLGLLILVVVIGAWRGVTSVFGLAISIFILAAFVIPRIVAGYDSFATCIQAAVIITLVSIYVAHGISKRTTVAFVSSLISLGVIIGLTCLASYITGTSEIIGEDNVGILYSQHPVDLAGLLTGGVVIASLGILFDITTGQAAIIDEIHKVNRKQSTGQLFVKGMSVGREHIAALINTLALVYAGVALPTIITSVVFAQNVAYAHIPLLVRLNTESVAEEVMRTCVASIGMLLALPITTWLAAYVLPRWTSAVDQKIKKWLREV